MKFHEDLLTEFDALAWTFNIGWKDISEVNFRERDSISEMASRSNAEVQRVSLMLWIFCFRWFQITLSISNFDNLRMLWICKAVDFYFEVPSVGPNVYIAYSLVGPGLFSKEPWDLHELVLKVWDFILSTSFHARISWFRLIPFLEFHERNITWWYLGVLHFRHMKLWWRYFYTVGM